MFLSLIVDAIGRYVVWCQPTCLPQKVSVILLDSREKIAAILLERASVSNEPYIRLARPLCCFRWRAGRPFMFNVSVGVLQFVVLRVVLAFIEPLTEALHVYKDVSNLNRESSLLNSLTCNFLQGVFGLRNAFGWCTIAMFFSQVRISSYASLALLSPFCPSISSAVGYLLPGTVVHSGEFAPSSKIRACCDRYSFCRSNLCFQHCIPWASS